MWKQKKTWEHVLTCTKNTPLTLRFLEKIAEINMVAKVLVACKGAFYKELKEYLTATQQCYTIEERVYAAEQCDSE